MHSLELPWSKKGDTIRDRFIDPLQWWSLNDAHRIPLLLFMGQAVDQPTVRMTNWLDAY